MRNTRTLLLALFASLAGLAFFAVAAFVCAETDEEVEAHRQVLDLTGAFTNDGFKLRDGHWAGQIKPAERALIAVNLYAGNQYWFFIYAKDAGGQVSGTVSATTRTLLDTTTPSTGPVVSVTEVGSNYVSLSWTPAQDDCPFLSYQVSVNGDPHTSLSPNLSTTVRLLAPQTTYSLTVRGRDEGNHWSPFSDPVSVTTLPPNPNDTTPPTTPANLTAYGTGDGSTETHVSWTQSTDDFDAQSNIRYDVYLNGVLQEVRFGSGGESIMYAELGENLIEVTATDTAGNTSAPATVTIFF